MGPWSRKGPCVTTQPANRLTLQKLTDPLRDAAAKTFDATETRSLEGKVLTPVYSYPVQIKHKLVKAANPVTAN
jgi:hypothetical protein